MNRLINKKGYKSDIHLKCLWSVPDHRCLWQIDRNGSTIYGTIWLRSRTYDNETTVSRMQNPPTHTHARTHARTHTHTQSPGSLRHLLGKHVSPEHWMLLNSIRSIRGVFKPVRMLTIGPLVRYRSSECIGYAELGQAWKYMAICYISFLPCRSIRKQIRPCHKMVKLNPESSFK